MDTPADTPDAVRAREGELDSFDAAVREKALHALADAQRRGLLPAVPARPVTNVHAHTFFSYNCYGYSPSHWAWLARRMGLTVAGIVDFDVLDGLPEFLAAGHRLDLSVCAGLESRVFVPEFAARVINSPGEPGISYHMGVGFPGGRLSRDAGKFLRSMRQSAESRNRDLLARVNAHLAPVTLDFDRDVVPLTPAGNVTERHICLAFARKAAAMFPTDTGLAGYWTDKLGEPADRLDLPAGVKLQNTIRARTMKQGGPGYVKPDAGSFPRLADMNRFVLRAGGIPTLTWLDGTSEGEQAMEELFAVACATGAAALNIIPDRNYKPGVKDRKLQNLRDIAALADRSGLPIIAGTEMNSPGQKLVDGFETEELSPLAPAFLKGARIVVAHAALQRHAGMGYTSAWARGRLPAPADRNDFFAEAGACLRPGGVLPARVNEAAGPADVLACLRGQAKEV